MYKRGENFSGSTCFRMLIIITINVGRYKLPSLLACWLSGAAAGEAFKRLRHSSHSGVQIIRFAHLHIFRTKPCQVVRYHTETWLVSPIFVFQYVFHHAESSCLATVNLPMHSISVVSLSLLRPHNININQCLEALCYPINLVQFFIPGSQIASHDSLPGRTSAAARAGK